MINIKRSITLILAACLLGVAGRAASLVRGGQRDHFTLASDDRKTIYVVDVWLPDFYRANPHPMPMLLMLDGEYAFESAVQISGHLQLHRELPEFIVVGLIYGVGFGDPLAAERSRDFTPPVDEAGSIKKVDTAYYHFMKDQLLPQLNQRFKIDAANRVLWAYSLSGSFAAWLNYFDPTLFDHYILASGNLMEFGIIQKLFQGQLFSGKADSGRRVFLSHDASEVPDPKIIEDARKLLANKTIFVGHEITYFLTKGESHATSWFAALPSSLRFIFGPHGEGTAGKLVDSMPAAGAVPPAHP